MPPKSDFNSRREANLIPSKFKTMWQGRKVHWIAGAKEMSAHANERCIALAENDSLA